MTKPVILTGIRSNEEPTLANYLGAFVPIVEMQRKYAGDYQINMFVPDLHSFTTPIDHQDLYQNTLTKDKSHYPTHLLSLHSSIQAEHCCPP